MFSLSMSLIFVVFLVSLLHRWMNGINYVNVWWCAELEVLLMRDVGVVAEDAFETDDVAETTLSESSFEISK